MRLCKFNQESLHTSSVESQQDEPEGAPRSGVCRCIELEPFVALINFCQRALSNGRPHAAQDGLKAEAGFVCAPDFYLVRRVRLSKSLCFKRQLFLNSACSSAEARRLLAGRGV